MSEFLTIREVAAKGMITENALRAMARQKRLPGFYAGNRFYVDFSMLQEQLRRECERNSINADMAAGASI